MIFSTFNLYVGKNLSITCACSLWKYLIFDIIYLHKIYSTEKFTFLSKERWIYLICLCSLYFKLKKHIRISSTIKKLLVMLKMVCMLIKHCVKSVQRRSFFWFVFSLIRTEYGDLRSICLHQTREIAQHFCQVYHISDLMLTHLNI